jgi:PAS domain S-box-containing protein
MCEGLVEPHHRSPTLQQQGAAMRIRRLLIAVAVAGAVLTALLLAGLLQVTRDSAAALRQQADSQEVARDVANLLTLSNEFAFYASERSAAQWRLRHGLLLATTEAALQRESEPPPALRQLHQAIETLPPLFDRLVLLASAPPTPLSQRRKELLLERLLAETQEVVDARYRWAEALGARQARDQRLYTLMVLGAPGLLLLLLIVLGLMVARRVLLPLARLQSAVTAMQGGDLGARCGSTADDELGDAARAVDAMAQALQKRDAALRDSEGRLRLVMDSVPALIGYVDRQRRYALVNQAYLLWHGRPEHEVVGAAVADFYDPAVYALLAPHFDRAFAGERVQFEVDVERHGKRFALAVTFVPEIDARGDVQGVYTMKADVSELRRAERRLRAVMEASPLGMFLAESNGQCLYVNAAWLRIAGLTLDASLGGGWRDAVHPADRAAVAVAWAALPGSSAVQAVEHRYRRPDGGVVWVRSHAVALREAGHEAGVVGTVEDITERRRLDESLVERSEALARSNAELEQFAYVASHDLQEPLRMVTSYGQLLARRHGERLDGEAREFLDFIVDGGRRAQALVGDLLGLARVSSQAQPFEAVALGEALAQARRSLRLAIDESGAVVTHDEPLPSVHGDRRQLVQLLHNLLANALKFRGDVPPRVHVGACREDGRWRIRVADNGIGIAAQHHGRVFVMFQRLHPRAADGGTGIGLAICKKVVERHGGRIGVESAPGQGSTFWFTLPAGPQEQT